jgi:biotin-(acetyl-CoA carboxylase) ligase
MPMAAVAKHGGQCDLDLGLSQAHASVVDMPEREWRRGEQILVTLSNDEVVSCRSSGVDEDGNMQVASEREVVR